MATRKTRLYLVNICYPYNGSVATFSYQAEATSPLELIKSAITSRNLQYNVFTPFKNGDKLEEPYAQVWLLGGVSERETLYHLGYKQTKKK